MFLRCMERIICDKQKKSTLLYKISRDGCDANTFHRLCDNKGPTLTIVYSVNNTIYGGYTSQSWTNEDVSMIKQLTLSNAGQFKGGPGVKTGGIFESVDTVATVVEKSKEEPGIFKDDINAFLFLKEDHAGSNIIKIPIREDKCGKAIFCGKGKGPTFGAGTFGHEKLVYKYDLMTFENSVAKSGKNSFLLNGYVKLGGAYDRGLTKSAKMKGGTMEVRDMEVYQIEIDELRGLWREIPKDVKLLREEFHSHKTFDTNLPYRNILLTGIIGSGKSSFRNLLESAIKGEIVRSSAYGDSEFSMTNQLTYNELTTTSERPMTVRIYDTRGMEETRGMEFEIGHILDGSAPDNFKFLEKSQPLDASCLKRRTGLHDEIHLVCMVMDATKLPVLTDKHKSHIKHIQKIASRKGLHMVGVVTKLDQICEKVTIDVKHLYKDPSVWKAIRTATAFLGLQENQVFPICNYSTEKVNNPVKDAMALESLMNMIRYIDETLQERRGTIQLEDDWILRGKNLGQKGMFLEEQTISIIQHSESKEHGFRVLLIGPTKAGKSSYINSVVSVLLKEIKSKVVAGKTDDERTKKLCSFPMKYRRGDGGITLLPVRLCDMRGIGDDNVPTNRDLEYILDGHVSYGDKIVENITTKSNIYKAEPKLRDKVHCVALVLDSDELSRMTSRMTERIRGIKTLLTQKEIPYMVLLTKVDILYRNLSSDVSKIYESKEVRRAADYVCQMFGIKLKDIFPIRNYDSKTFIDSTMDEILLESFQQAVKLCETFIEKVSEREEDEDFIASSDSVC